MDEMDAPVGRLGRLFAWLGGVLFATSLLYFLYSYAVRYSTAPSPDASGGTAGRAVAVNLVLFGIFAVHHSVMARTGAKRALARLFEPALERSVYVWVASVLFLLTCHAWRPVPGLVYVLAPPWHVAGLAAIAAGVWLIVDAARAMDVLELAGIRQATGGVGPVALQARGAYGLVRHPIYLGWALLTFGAPVMTATRLSFAVISTLYLIIAIPIEERALRASFGEAYVKYAQHVRWRLVPGLY